MWGTVGATLNRLFKVAPTKEKKDTKKIEESNSSLKFVVLSILHLNHLGVSFRLGRTFAEVINFVKSVAKEKKEDANPQPGA